MHTTTELLSTAEAAELLGKNRSTITRWVKSGRLKPVHTVTPGNIYLFDRAQLEAVSS